MKFVYASTFDESLARLDPQSRSLAKEKAYDFQRAPDHPGFKFHKVERAKDPHFWSARVNDDIRMIVHKQGDSFYLCYVGRHDAAYRWAESKKKIAEHPKTGAIYFATVEERVEEVVRQVERYVEPPLFAHHDPEYLYALGVPDEWMQAVQHVGEQGLFELLEELPQEAAERLIDLAAGKPVPTPKKPSRKDPLEHPDTRRRFRVIADDADLRRALEAPLQKWVVFLHPSQSAAVEARTSGAYRVSGAAGTGKTVVAMHRVRELLQRSETGDILLTTFSTTLAQLIDEHLGYLVPPDDPARHRVRVVNLHKLAFQMYGDFFGRGFRTVDDRALNDLLEDGIRRFQVDRSLEFVRTEWKQVVDPRYLRNWDEYREVSRAGRGTALGARQRRELWQVFEFVLEKLREHNQLTFDTLCHRVAAELQRRGEQPFRHVVVDECQDFGIPELALIRALAPEGPDDLYFCGDMAQQIYKIPFSWASVGLAIRGRSTRLKVNYRTTEQIRQFADGLLPSEIRSRDDDDESRDAISLMRGPDPRVTPCPGVDAEVDTVAAWLRDVRDAGIDPDEIAIFARSKKVLRQRGESAARKAGLDSVLLAEEADGRPGCVSLGTMHRAKGLEYRAVAVVGVDDGLVPLKAALRDAIDDVDREAVREQERQLLYVAMTRAREELLVTSGGEVSEFLVSTTPH